MPQGALEATRRKQTIMSRKTTKVEIPKNADELLILLHQVLAKNAADGVDSPIKSLHMSVMQDKTDIAEASQAASKNYERMSQIETAKRDEAIGTAQTTDSALYILTQVRDLLLTIYKSNPKMLGEWGFTVIEGTVSATAATPPASKAS